MGQQHQSIRKSENTTQQQIKKKKRMGKVLDSCERCGVVFLFALFCVVGFVGWYLFVVVFNFGVLRSLGFNYTPFMLPPGRFCLAIIFRLFAIYSHQKPKNNTNILGTIQLSRECIFPQNFMCSVLLVMLRAFCVLVVAFLPFGSLFLCFWSIIDVVHFCCPKPSTGCVRNLSDSAHCAKP